MGEDELVRRILDEADMAARPGQYDRLVAIANEVAALREQYVVEEFIDTDGYPSMRVVKGEHVGQNEWAANIRREVLADLRAKVESVPRIAAVSRGTGAYVPCVQLSDVLALIEEADRG